MANRGWDKVRKSLGRYPVPPIKPGGKWRPPGADLPPAPPPSEVQRVVDDLHMAAARLQLLRSGCKFAGRDAPEFKEDFLALAELAEQALIQLSEWQRRTAKKREKHADDHAYAWHQKQNALAAERREKYRLERLEKAKKDRARKKRDKERAQKNCNHVWGHAELTSAPICIVCGMPKKRVRKAKA